MQSWIDLDEEKQKQLKKEFKSKRHVIDLRILFYILALVSAFPAIVSILAENNNSCYENTCQNNILIYGTIFVIFLLAGIINSILISKNQKEFISWLRTRKIEK